ncbi:MAG: transposase [Bacteroidota bacterium]
MKYSPEIVNRIVELLASGDYTINDVCKQVGINQDTFYDWKANKSEFSEALKQAEKDRLLSFKRMARSGLAKIIDVFEYEEVTTEYIDGKDKEGNSKPKIKSRKVVKKFIMPNATAVIFALTNMDADNWKHKSDQGEGDREPPKPIVFKPIKPDGRDSQI